MEGEFSARDKAEKLHFPPQESLWDDNVLLVHLFLSRFISV